MGKWTREKVNSENLNGGNQYEAKDRLSREQLNAMVNSGLYAQDFAEHLADTPDTSDADNVGVPTVELIDNGKFKKFKFSNLKGEKGEKGDTGEAGGKKYIHNITIKDATGTSAVYFNFINNVSTSYSDIGSLGNALTLILPLSSGNNSDYISATGYRDGYSVIGFGINYLNDGITFNARNILSTSNNTTSVTSTTKMDCVVSDLVYEV